MKHKKGFTLVEVLIALLVTSIIIIGVYTLFAQSIKLNANQNDFIHIQEGLRTSGLKIETDIRRSSQELEINKKDYGNKVCYDIHDTKFDQTIEYCLEEQSLMRNGLLISEFIHAFEIYLIDEPDGRASININIVGNREDMSYDKKIFLRTP